ncbi:lactonase family protein [Streptomyces sp. NBC_01356]|uniref:lactonase family protein n=1 Tax=Streptomyces sp. NBC_01356 TaxID=2903836 RepID=UPI002E33BB83|nr:lactonase family protein [Streptomyces sp. NBC_01356]
MSHLPSRRTVLLASAGSTFALAGAAPGAAAATDASAVSVSRGHARVQYAYVGSRTTKARNARGVGITVWRVGPGWDSWDLLQTVPADDGDPSTPTPAGAIPVNPSFLALNSDGTRLYAVHGDAANVSAFSVNASDGTLTLLNTVDVGRRNPVHLTLDPTGRWLVVAFLAVPGCVVSLPVGADGSLGAAASVLELPGTPGPHKSAQLGPNPHHAVFDPTGRWLLIPDRGLDRVFVAALDATTGALTLNDPGWTQTRELEGPRHIAFHPDRPLAYVINELRSTVTTYKWNATAGVLTPVEVQPSTAPSTTGDFRAAEIAVSPGGGHVFASNRSGAGDATPGGPDPDTIGVFAVERHGGLKPVGWVSTQGIRPRFFGLEPSGQRLFAANEVTDTIAGFTLGADGRHLRPLGVVAETGSPTCIVWRAAN